MSTYADLKAHIIFGTKHRQPWIHEDWRARLHAYLAGTLSGLEAKAIAIGGTSDHVHLLVSYRPKQAVADLVREVKKASTLWVHTERQLLPFAWQDGYAVFSVSNESADHVARYIQNQEEHHREQSAIGELRYLLSLSDIEFSERFLD